MNVFITPYENRVYRKCYREVSKYKLELNKPLISENSWIEIKSDWTLFVI